MKENRWIQAPISLAVGAARKGGYVSEDNAILEMYWLASQDSAQLVDDMPLKRGQFVASIAQLIEDWGWSEESVYTFLHTLSAEFVKYIHIREIAGDNDTLVITMLKYYDFVKTA